MTTQNNKEIIEKCFNLIFKHPLKEIGEILVEKEWVTSEEEVEELKQKLKGAEE